MTCVIFQVTLNPIEIWLFTELLAKLLLYIVIIDWLRSLWVEKINSFLLVNKRTKEGLQIIWRNTLYYKHDKFYENVCPTGENWSSSLVL